MNTYIISINETVNLYDENITMEYINPSSILWYAENEVVYLVFNVSH